MKRNENSVFPILDFITKTYPREKYPKILEVAAGNGNFAELLSELGYEVTAMDPKIELKRGTNYKIDKAYFDENTNISEYDLGIAIHPCGIHEPIIKNFMVNDKALFMIPCCTFKCKGYHPETLGYKNNDEWLKHLQSLDFDLKKKRLYKKAYHPYDNALYTK